MVKISVFVREETCQHIRDIAESWDVSASLVARAAIWDFLVHPERECEVLLPHLETVKDTRTDGQRDAGERYQAAMAQVDMEAIGAQLEQQGAEERR